MHHENGEYLERNRWHECEEGKWEMCRFRKATEVQMQNRKEHLASDTAFLNRLKGQFSKFTIWEQNALQWRDSDNFRKRDSSLYKYIICKREFSRNV